MDFGVTENVWASEELSYEINIMTSSKFFLGISGCL